MDIKLIRLSSRKVLDIKKDDDAFIEEINGILFDEDLYLTENAPKDAPTVIFVESGGVEMSFKKLLPSISQFPIVLLCTNKNNSLPACLEIYTYCMNNFNIPCVIANDGASLTAELLSIVSEVSMTYTKLQNNNLGVIIGESDWLIASHVDYSIIKDKLHFNIVKIGKSELYNEINKKKIGKPLHFSTLTKKCKDKVELQKALYVYGALKRLTDKYNLSGLTIKCFDLLEEYKTTACLALSLLNDEGITAGCEGDVPTLITMHFINALTDRPCFMANPSIIDRDNNTILLAHCTCPINMFKDYEFNTHFESGLGIATQGKLNHGEISILKICPDLKHVVAIRGEIKKDVQKEGYCRTQALVELPPSDANMLMMHAFGNHLVLTYGDITEKFLALFNLYKLLYKDKEFDE